MRFVSSVYCLAVWASRPATVRGATEGTIPAGHIIRYPGRGTQPGSDRAHGTQPRTTPTVPMRVSAFTDLFLGLPWQRAGRIK
jgi:hypothetical protein